MNKKEYSTPEMTVLQMDLQDILLLASGPDVIEYDGEFGYNTNTDTNKIA